jgi:hypothetical protein
MKAQLWTVVEWSARAAVGAAVILFILAHVVPERLLPWNQGKSEGWWMNRAKSKANALDPDAQFDGVRGR